MRKLFSKWVPRLLTPDQKQQRVEDLDRCLELFTQGKKGFLRQYVTMDETWIRHYTPETKRSSAEWTAAGESRPMRKNTQQWAGKVMASVFWDAHGILCPNGRKKSHCMLARRAACSQLRLGNAIGRNVHTARFNQKNVHITRHLTVRG